LPNGLFSLMHYIIPGINMSKIQEDSYWYIEKVEPYEDGRIRAMCVECAKTSTQEQLMHWPGHKGYGHYDLDCSICKKAIYRREEEGVTVE